MKINITSLRIWATDFDATPTNSLKWQETTVGHEDSTSATNYPLIIGWPNWGDDAVYTQVLWDPNDFQVVGTTQTRTFALFPNNTAGNPAIDGFEVFGNVQLIYDAIPEPGALGAMGLVALIGVRMRSRRCALSYSLSPSRESNVSHL